MICEHQQQAVLILLCFFSLSVFAESAKNTDLKYIDSQNNNLQTQESHRKQWSLSQEEWSRYQTLMKGIRGSISPKTISPIEVLGTHARNEAERKKYAETWVRMRHDDINRILAFQRAYNQAFTRLYPNEKMINLALLDQKPEPVLVPGDRLLVFLKLAASCVECASTVNNLMQTKTTKGVKIDIYFVDTNPTKDDYRIRQWAKQNNIDTQRIKSGNITLNHDKGTLYKITKNMTSQVPLVFKLNKKRITQILDF